MKTDLIGLDWVRYRQIDRQTYRQMYIRRPLPCTFLVHSMSMKRLYAHRELYSTASKLQVTVSREKSKVHVTAEDGKIDM